MALRAGARQMVKRCRPKFRYISARASSVETAYRVMCAPADCNISVVTGGRKGDEERGGRSGTENLSSAGPASVLTTAECRTSVGKRGDF